MPAFRFNCPHCQQPLESPEDMLGQETICPTCKRTIQIPDSTRTRPLASNGEHPLAQETPQAPSRNAKSKFNRFCVVWVLYMILVSFIFRFMLVPRYGGFATMIPAVVIAGLIAWLPAILAWGPVRGQWANGESRKVVPRRATARIVGLILTSLGAGAFLYLLILRMLMGYDARFMPLWPMFAWLGLAIVGIVFMTAGRKEE